MRPLRILYVNHTSARGGCAASLRYLIQSFPPGRVEAHVVCPVGDAADEFERAGIAVTRVPAVSMFEAIDSLPPRGLRLLLVGRSIWNLRTGRYVRAAMARLRPDLVHLNDFGMVQAAISARKLGIPVVSHVRYVADRTTAWWRRLTHGVVRSSVAAVLAIDGSVRYAVRELPNLSVVYNPLGPEILQRGHAHTVGATAAVEDATRTTTQRAPLQVIYLGGLHPKKGIYDVIECIRRLQSRTDIVFHIVGGNTRPRAFYATWRGRLATRLGFIADVEQQLHAFVEAHGLQDRVRVHGYVSQPLALLAQADILLAPSQTNGLGRPVFEAGVLGIPSVVTLRDRIQDIVEDGVTGLIVPEGDIAGVVAAIERCADDRAMVAAMGARSAQKYQAQFDPTVAARAVLTAYERVLAGVPDPSGPVRRAITTPPSGAVTGAMAGAPGGASGGAA